MQQEELAPRMMQQAARVMGELQAPRGNTHGEPGVASRHRRPRAGVKPPSTTTRQKPSAGARTETPWRVPGQVTETERNASEPTDDLSKVKIRRCQKRGLSRLRDQPRRYVASGPVRHPALRGPDRLWGACVEDGNLLADVNGEVTSGTTPQGRAYGGSRAGTDRPVVVQTPGNTGRAKGTSSGARSHGSTVLTRWWGRRSR